MRAPPDAYLANPDGPRKGYPMPALFCYLAAASLLGAGLTVFDKRRARRGGHRIRERTLISVAALGGSPGVLAAMYAVRHKTQKAKFRYGIPALLAAQLLLAAGAVWLCRR